MDKLLQAMIDEAFRAGYEACGMDLPDCVSVGHPGFSESMERALKTFKEVDPNA
jgi:hypothetical protein